MNRRVLTANKGKVLTDGETYGKVIYLAEGVSEKGFYEITEEEYSEMQEKGDTYGSENRS